MTTEREQLAFIAKAMGIELKWVDEKAYVGTPVGRLWNPREFSGDCFEMETALGIDVLHYKDMARARYWVDADDQALESCELFSQHNNDKNAARRAASCAVAAEIGRAMK